MCEDFLETNPNLKGIRMPEFVITSKDASKIGLLASVDRLVWQGNIQWAFCGFVRWTV